MVACEIVRVQGIYTIGRETKGVSRKNSYEGIFIIKPDLSEDGTKKVIDGLSEEILKGGGTVDESAPMGKQRLAYRIEDYDDGYYLRVVFSATPETLVALERQLKLNQNIIRHLIVKSG